MTAAARMKTTSPAMARRFARDMPIRFRPTSVAREQRRGKDCAATSGNSMNQRPGAAGRRSKFAGYRTGLPRRVDRAPAFGKRGAKRDEWGTNEFETPASAP